MGRGSDDRKSRLTQPMQITSQRRPRVPVVDTLQRNEVVVPSDLVPVIVLKPQEGVGEIGPGPVWRGVEHKERRAHTVVVLDTADLERVVEILVDIVAQPDDRSAV